MPAINNIQKELWQVFAGCQPGNNRIQLFLQKEAILNNLELDDNANLKMFTQVLRYVCFEPYYETDDRLQILAVCCSVQTPVDVHFPGVTDEQKRIYFNQGISRYLPNRTLLVYRLPPGYIEEEAIIKLRQLFLETVDSLDRADAYVVKTDANLYELKLRVKPEPNLRLKLYHKVLAKPIGHTDTEVIHVQGQARVEKKRKRFKQEEDGFLAFVLNRPHIRSSQGNKIFQSMHMLRGHPWQGWRERWVKHICPNLTQRQALQIRQRLSQLDLDYDRRAFQQELQQARRNNAPRPLVQAVVPPVPPPPVPAPVVPPVAPPVAVSFQPEVTVVVRRSKRLQMKKLRSGGRGSGNRNRT